MHLYINHMKKLKIYNRNGKTHKLLKPIREMLIYHIFNDVSFKMLKVLNKNPIGDGKHMQQWSW